MASTFLYFAYGSNLLMKRIHFNNPTAVRKDIGRLKNYRLDFITYTKRWGGAAATIVPTENCSVWGAIWELDTCNLSTLDCQEGVMDNIYFPLMVNVETPSGTVLECRVYQQCNIPANYIKPMFLPIERRPSPLYLETIIKGAQESQLPDSYIQFLKMISHNGFKGKCEIRIVKQNVVFNNGARSGGVNSQSIIYTATQETTTILFVFIVFNVFKIIIRVLLNPLMNPLKIIHIRFEQF